MSRVLVTEMGFGLVIGFINRLQLVTTSTNNYNTVTDFHSTSTPRQSSESISTCLLPATALNTGIITDSHFKYHTQRKSSTLT
jgi:hypothetical protein